MNTNNEYIDHLVYCVHDLDASIREFEEKYGFQINVGGRHLHHGTRNALINLGQNCYLELLAIDRGNKQVYQDRWMGIDLLTEDKLTRWAISSSDLDRDHRILSDYNEQMGIISTGSRQRPDTKVLNWKMTLPLSQPEVEVIPFLIDWSESESHPTDGLSVQGQLLGLELSHPEPDRIKSCLAHLGHEVVITQSEETIIKATIKGPKGQFQI